MTEPLLPRFRGWSKLGLLLCLTIGSAGTPAAEIVLERPVIEQLFRQALFKREGKLDLKTGPCYAYLENPSVELKGGRIHIRSRLSSRSGIEVSGNCLGVGLASWTVVSGMPVARNGVVRLEDMRIDRVEDSPTRMLVQSGLIPRLPAAIELDVMKAVSEMLGGVSANGAFRASLDRFAIDAIEADNNRLTVRFDFRLVAR